MFCEYSNCKHISTPSLSDFCTASKECCHKSRDTLGWKRRQGCSPGCLGQGQMTRDVLLAWAAWAALQVTRGIQGFPCISVPRGWRSQRVGHSPVREDDEWRWCRLRGAPRQVPTKQWSFILPHPTRTGGHWMKLQAKGASVLCKSQLNCRACGMFS